MFACARICARGDFVGWPRLTDGDILPRLRSNTAATAVHCRDCCILQNLRAATLAEPDCYNFSALAYFAFVRRIFTVHRRPHHIPRL